MKNTIKPNTLYRFAPLLAFMVTFSACNQSQQATNSAASNTDNSSAPSAQNNVSHQNAREDIMEAWGAASKEMGAMIKDPASFNADNFRAAAQKLDQDAWVHFPAGSEGGESKPEIWQNPTAFQEEINKYKHAVAALNTAAQSATSAADVQAQFGEVGASCKSCHEQFREK